jgi:GNAT superfamily N-acetyltransferase
MLNRVSDAEVRVRAAVDTDATEIGAAHAAAWIAAYDHIFDSDFLRVAAEGRSTGWPSSIHRLLVAPNILLVGELGGRVVAFAHAAPLPDTRTAEIVGFYCHPDAWGTGVARLLMTRAWSAVSEEADDVILWTLRDAHRARRFYEKMGFRTTGRTQLEPLTNWTDGVTVERPAVEYTASLRT